MNDMKGMEHFASLSETAGLREVTQMLLIETAYDRHLAELRGMGSLHVGRVGIHVATPMAHGRYVLGRHRSAKAALKHAYEYIRDCKQADNTLSAMPVTI